MGRLRIATLDVDNLALVESSTTLIVQAFGEPERYGAARVGQELTARDPWFYRRFFLAMEDGRVLGIGGIKAADWAQNTHLLYLSAVEPGRRGEGIGRALIEARLAWVEKRFARGRILVSTARVKRYRELGFVEIRNGSLEGRHLMMRRFR